MLMEQLVGLGIYLWSTALFKDPPKCFTHNMETWQLKRSHLQGETSTVHNSF